MNYQVSKSPDLEVSPSLQQINMGVQNDFRQNIESTHMMHRYQDLQEEKAVRLNMKQNTLASIDAMVQQTGNSEGQQLKIFDYENKMQVTGGAKHEHFGKCLFKQL